MELYEPRRKKNYQFKAYVPLNKLQNKISSHFNGFSVVIENPNDMRCIYEKGFFGKANLSRSCPANRSNEILRKRQFLKRKEWEAKGIKDGKLTKIVVVPDSDTDDENYFVNLKPEYQIDKSGIKEALFLSLVEAYFLATYLKCLNIYEDNIILDEENIWKNFIDSDTHFISNYITYSHFRKKGWIVKTGIKFGGDYVLYKDGPPYYHASYIVIIDVLNEDLARRKDMQTRSMDIVDIIGLNRLCETAGKELLICQLIWPINLLPINDNDLSKITINEILLRRWKETQEN